MRLLSLKVLTFKPLSIFCDHTAKSVSELVDKCGDRCWLNMLSKRINIKTLGNRYGNTFHVLNRIFTAVCVSCFSREQINRNIIHVQGVKKPITLFIGIYFYSRTSWKKVREHLLCYEGRCWTKFFLQSEYTTQTLIRIKRLFLCAEGPADLIPNIFW